MATDCTNRVLTLVADACGKEVTPDSSFDDLDFDSLDFVDLMLAVETVFSIRIEHTDYPALNSVADLISLVESLHAIPS